MNKQYNCTILFNRAIAYSKVNLLQETLNDLSKAIEINPEYVKAYMKRGDIYMSQQQYEEAMHDFAKVKEIDPCNYLIILIIIL